MKKKRLVRGVDWHAWVWKAGKTWPKPDQLFRFVVADRRHQKKPTETGRWVRVRFVEAQP